LPRESRRGRDALPRDFRLGRHGHGRLGELLQGALRARRLALTDVRSGHERIPPHHDPSCWGCGDNPDGIHLPLPTEEGIQRYEAGFSFAERHQAAPGIVHGGLVGAALDEACGLLATWHRFPTVTARIFVRFRRPVLIHKALTVAAWVTDSRGRRIRIDGELRDGEEILAEARAAFLHVPLEHFLASPEGQAAGLAWQRRLHSEGE
jgi:acyl-coenzyme A thioesterase PaaI-like protein